MVQVTGPMEEDLSPLLPLKSLPPAVEERTCTGPFFVAVLACAMGGLLTGFDIGA